jgi:hypothetical protein
LVGRDAVAATRYVVFAATGRQYGYKADGGVGYSFLADTGAGVFNGLLTAAGGLTVTGTTVHQGTTTLQGAVQFSNVGFNVRDASNNPVASLGNTGALAVRSLNLTYDDGTTAISLVPNNATFYPRFHKRPIVGPDQATGVQVALMTDLDGLGGGGGLTTEQVDDRIATTYDDTTNTLTISATVASLPEFPVAFLSPTEPANARSGDVWIVGPDDRPPEATPRHVVYVAMTEPTGANNGDLWVVA